MKHVFDSLHHLCGTCFFKINCIQTTWSHGGTFFNRTYTTYAKRVLGCLKRGFTLYYIFVDVICRSFKWWLAHRGHRGTARPEFPQTDRGFEAGKMSPSTNIPLFFCLSVSSHAHSCKFIAYRFSRSYPFCKVLLRPSIFYCIWAPSSLKLEWSLIHLLWEGDYIALSYIGQGRVIYIFSPASTSMFGWRLQVHEEAVMWEDADAAHSGVLFFLLAHTTAQRVDIRTTEHGLLCSPIISFTSGSDHCLCPYARFSGCQLTSCCFSTLPHHWNLHWWQSWACVRLMIQACIRFYFHYAKPWPVFLSAQLAALSVCMCSVSILCVPAAAKALCISALHSAASPLPPPHANSAAPPLSMCRKSSLQCVCVRAAWMMMLYAWAESCKVTERMEKGTELWPQWRCSALFLRGISHPSISLSSLSLSFFPFLVRGGLPVQLAASLPQLQQHQQVRTPAY